MAFVHCDPDRTWVAQEGFNLCPQIPQALAADDGYYMFDFSEIISREVAISSAVITEKNSKTVTMNDQSVSDDGQKVSFQATGHATGDFTFVCTATLSTGTSQVISRTGTLRVS